ncbi:MAG: BatD family protein [Lysobacteraceae bacterium]
MSIRARAVLGLLLLLATFPAFAQVRAWLDRDRIGLDETAALNIETDQPDAPPPDYAPLQRDFVVSGNTSSRQFEVANGVAHARTLYSVALQPRREGALVVPALAVGNARTAPLTLTVTAAQSAPAHAGDPVFIETEADAQSPYVQQAVGYTVRLYYATQLVSGQLDQDAPEGASLQRVGDDVQYEREVGGRRYHVVERHYLLIPEHSGTLAIPGARFSGRGVGGLFGDLFGGGDADLRASSPPRVLAVRAAPANAPQPWLPLRALDLRYTTAPRAARAGEATTVTVEADADGATAAQLPELQLQAGDGAQVFADPPQSDERFVDGRPQVHLTRRFSIVPAQAGRLRISGPSLAWWDVRAGAARTATLPDLELQVAPGAATTGGAPATAASASPAEPATPPAGRGIVRQPWALVAVAFALLWLLTLAWALSRRGPARPECVAGAPAAPRDATDARALHRALAHGDLAEITGALCAAAGAGDLDAVRARLDDAAQQRAIDALQRARWGGGDAAQARGALRAAFRAGPRWRRAGRAPDALLPPLYPG